MTTLLKFGVLAATTTTALTIGFLYRHKFYQYKNKIYDKRFGGLHLEKDICTSLKESISCPDKLPVMGLDFPLESTLLILVQEGTQKLIMSLGKNKKNKLEWTLVGGKVESQKRTDEKFIDFNDARFIVDGKQISPDECADIIFENPKKSLAREVMEELTGNKKFNQEEENKFDWLIKKIYDSNDWVFVKTNKSVKLNETDKLDGFSTYMGLCKVMLSERDISLLNDVIESYEEREHRFFIPKEWHITEFESNGKNKNCFTVKVDDNDHPVRNYNANIMFVHYWKEFNELIMKDT